MMNKFIFKLKLFLIQCLKEIKNNCKFELNMEGLLPLGFSIGGIYAVLTGLKHPETVVIDGQISETTKEVYKNLLIGLSIISLLSLVYTFTNLCTKDKEIKKAMFWILFLLVILSAIAKFLADMMA